MKIKKTVLHVFSFCTLVGAIASNTIWAEPTVSISATALNVESIERSEKFYSEVFGLTRVFQYPPQGEPVIEIGMTPPGQASLMLILAHFSDDPLPEGKKAYGRVIFNTDNALAIAAKAEERGATIRNLSSPGGATIIFFDDPDGYDVELYQAVDPSE